MPGYLDSTPHPWTKEDIARAALDFKTVEASIDSTEGGKIWNDLKELDDTAWILSTSVTELVDEVCMFGERSKSLNFWTKNNEKNAEQYVREVKRKLYYCTSAVMTLVDISRNFGRRWDVVDSLSKRNEFFCTPGLHEFLQGLRNFSTHWRIAEANWLIKTDENGIRSTHFTIGRTELLAWSSWTANAKKYINDSGDHIDIQKIFTLYSEQAHEFYGWHKGAVLEQHAHELQKYFNYRRMYEQHMQYMKWNMILSSLPPSFNPYKHLHKYLDNSQLEIVLSYPHRSEQQVNAIIKQIDVQEICDQNLRSKAMKVFSVDSPVERSEGAHSPASCSGSPAAPQET
ncbi:hypothetical protein EC849_117134 [Pseudomonas putida]|uniref:hypothetical protein n=1 Tax=Pseudomonas putida TaxID=303 RepID=UPI0010431A22|nr:hypothetical protein [Pseudomonas putida]TCP73447.1 hypothetical protein EC849_117134 [Pseudomonas putida]